MDQSGIISGSSLDQLWTCPQQMHGRYGEDPSESTGCPQDVQRRYQIVEYFLPDIIFGKLNRVDIRKFYSL